MTNLDCFNTKKQRHHFIGKGPYSQTKIFSVVMYGLWELDIKKVEHWRIYGFELGCCRKFLRALWTARRSNQSIQKEITLNTHWKNRCWSWNYNTLVTWCKESTHWKRPWCWERLRAGGEGATEDEMVYWHYRLNGHEFKQTQGDCEDRGAWNATVHGVTKSQTQLSDSTKTARSQLCKFILLVPVFLKAFLPLPIESHSFWILEVLPFMTGLCLPDLCPSLLHRPWACHCIFLI